MTSQKSTNKSSICLLALIREDLRHKHWMLALSILGSFLAGPVAVLFILSMIHVPEQKYLIIDDGIYSTNHEFIMTLSQYYADKLDNAQQFLNVFHFVLMLCIAFIGAMIVAFLGFRHLYHRQMVDLYHGIPVSRKKLFLSGWLSGLLIWLVPAMISSFIVALILIIYLEGMFFGTILVETLLVLLKLTVCFLIVYNVCLVGVMLSGNILNALVSGLAYGLSVAMIVVCYFFMAQYFFDTFYMSEELLYTNPLYAFSPLTTPIILAYQWASREPYLTYYAWHLCGGILLCALNFVLAAYLYLKRPSELSERGLENKPVRILLRGSISLIGGLFFAMVCYMGADSMFPWMVFGTVLGSALTFCVLNVIFHCTFKKVISHKIQYLIVMALSVAFISILRFDLLGYDKRLPNEKDIKGISIFCYAMQEDDCNYKLQDGKLVRVRSDNAPADFIACDDPAKIHALLSACITDTKNHWNYDMRTDSINVKVKTTFGSYYRTYELLSKNAVELLAPMVETEEFAKNYFPIQSLEFGNPIAITISNGIIKEVTIEDDERIDELMQAFHQDFEEHRTVYDLLRKSRKFRLMFVYPREDGFNCTFLYEIPYCYEHTISLVEEWYPHKEFDPGMGALSRFSMDASFDIEEGEELHDALYRYFGYDPDGNPLSSPIEKSVISNRSPRGYVYWNFDLSEEDRKLLAAQEPYLIWGRYMDPLYNEYMEFGWGTTLDGQQAKCFIRYGKMPLEILQEMEQNAKIVLYDYDDEIYGSTNDPYYAEKYYID